MSIEPVRLFSLTLDERALPPHEQEIVQTSHILFAWKENSSSADKLLAFDEAVNKLREWLNETYLSNEKDSNDNEQSSSISS